MKAATPEIRAFVVQAYKSGKASRQQLAEIFGYHIQSIGNWIREYEREGRLAPLGKGHRRAAFTMDEQQKIIELLAIQPDMTLNEIKTQFNKDCSLTAIHKMLVKLGFVYKKNSEGKRAKSRGHNPTTQ